MIIRDPHRAKFLAVFKQLGNWRPVFLNCLRILFFKVVEIFEAITHEHFGYWLVSLGDVQVRVYHLITCRLGELHSWDGGEKLEVFTLSFKNVILLC